MIVRLLLWILVGYVAYTLYLALRRSLRPPTRPPEKTSRGEEMVRDPQCGTYLPKSDAQSVQVDGKTLYFCSPECREAYQKPKSS